MKEKTYENRKIIVPTWEKLLLTIKECVAYSGIGEHKLRELVNDPDCEFVVQVGTKKLIKRKRFEEFIGSISTV
ncbi:MAG: transposase [Clostridiales bacterium]|nr:transposase [Clostridiales bacterium]